MQAEQLGAHLRALPASLQPEVVIVSPLRRTLETAVSVFGGGPVLNGDAAAAELLMVAMEDVPEVRCSDPSRLLQPPRCRHGRRRRQCCASDLFATVGPMHKQPIPLATWHVLMSSNYHMNAHASRRRCKGLTHAVSTKPGRKDLLWGCSYVQ